MSGRDLSAELFGDAPSSGGRDFSAELFGDSSAPMDRLDAVNGTQAPQETPEPSLFEKFKAGVNVGAGMLQNAVVAPVANITGAVSELVGQGAPGTAESVSQAVMNRFGRQPQSQLESDYGQNVANAFASSKLEGLPWAGNELGQIARATPQAGPGIRAVANAVRNEAGLVKAAAAPAGRAVVNVGGKMIAVPAKIAQELAGFTTGVGPESFAQAFKAGAKGDTTLAANMRGQIPIEQVLTDAKQGLSNIQDANSLAYKTAKTGWAADKTKLDFAPIDAAYQKLDDTLNVNGHSMIGTAERAKITEVKDVLDEWRGDSSSHTTLGLDALKRRLDAIYPDNYNQTQAQRVITGTRNAVKDAIVQQAPEYADAMKNYETQLGVIREIQKALSLGNKTAADTALRKLQSLTRNNVNTNYGYRQGLADQLAQQGGVDVMPAVAGQSLSSWTPRGLARLGAEGGGVAAALTQPSFLPALLTTSPRLMGEAFYGAGKVAGSARRLSDAFRK